jgi:L-alanine-DL-glutamate epimerase-like enolase superfamily enzyme
VKITRARVLAYDVALRKPLVTSTSTINRRNGFLLELGGSGRVEHAAADRRGSADLRGYGEAAPVWWLGEGTVEEAGAALRRAAELVSSAAAEADDWLALLRAIDVAGATADEACVAGARSDWSTALSRCWSGWPPSVRSAVVTAVLDVGARLRGSSVAELLADGSVATRLATSRLLAGEDERALASSAAAAVEAAF